LFAPKNLIITLLDFASLFTIVKETLLVEASNAVVK
jgi:hypothetical protein